MGSGMKGASNWAFYGQHLRVTPLCSLTLSVIIAHKFMLYIRFLLFIKKIFSENLKKIVVFPVIAFLLGCSAKTIPPLPYPPAPSLDGLLTIYQEKRVAMPSFRGRFDVITRMSSEKKSFYMLLRTQDNGLKMSGVNILGQSLFTLAMTDTALEIVLSATGETVHFDRRAPDQNHPILSLPFIQSAQDFFMFLDSVRWGGIPIPGPNSSRILETSGDKMMLAVYNDRSLPGGSSLLYHIDRTHLQTQKLEIFDPDGIWVSTLTFSDYRKVSTMDYPFLIQGMSKTGQISLRAREILPVLNQ